MKKLFNKSFCIKIFGINISYTVGRKGYCDQLIITFKQK